MAEGNDLLSISLQEFEDWLREQNEDAVVGEARNALADPLCHFLRERLGRAALVGREKIRLGDKVLRLPEWAREYLRLADTSGTFAPITAAHALNLLATVRSEPSTETSGLGQRQSSTAEPLG